jgi:tetratricopeptide (TPR) repeat protein/DNA-binding CsgD family transcriptional regulator
MLNEKLNSIESNVAEGEKLLAESNFARAEGYFQDALSRIPPHSAHPSLPDIYLNLGSIMNSRGDIHRSIHYYHHARLSAAAQENFHVQVRALINVAFHITQSGLPEEASEYYNEALKISSAQKLPILESRIYLNLSELALIKGELIEAMRLCNKVLELSKILGNPDIELRARIRSATIFVELGEYQKALAILSEMKEVSNLNFLITIEVIYGKTLRLLGDYSESRRHLEKGLKLCQATNDKRLILNTEHHLAELYIDEKKFPDAEILLERVLGESKEMNDAYCIQASYELLSSLYTKQGQFEKGLQYFKLYYEQEKKVLSQNAERRMQLLEIEHQVREKQKEAELYRLKSEQLEKELMSKTSYLISQNEMLSSFRSEMRKLLSEPRDSAAVLKKVGGKLKELPSISIDWEEYHKHFSIVHPDFSKNLLERFPDLTPTEAKICTFLRVGLSTNEMASLLCVTHRNIENHRYRLRRKLGLSEEQKLLQFLTTV